MSKYVFACWLSISFVRRNSNIDIDIDWCLGLADLETHHTAAVRGAGEGQVAEPCEPALLGRLRHFQ